MWYFTGDTGHHGAGVAASAEPGSTLGTETRLAVDSEEGSVTGASASASPATRSSVSGQKVRGKPDYDKIFNVSEIIGMPALIFFVHIMT